MTTVGPAGADTIFYQHAVSVTDPNQSTWPGVFCDDNAPYTAYLVMDGVRSNSVTFSAPAPQQPPPPPAGASISASQGGQYGCSNCSALNIAVHNFPTGTYTYYCHDNSGPGESDPIFYQHAVSVTDPNQSTWPGVFCDDNAPYTAYLVMDGVRSNSVTFSAPAPQQPPPPPAGASISASQGGQYGCSNCSALNIVVHNFPTGTYTYYCHDNSGPGGSDTIFYQHAVSVHGPQPVHLARRLLRRQCALHRVPCDGRRAVEQRSFSAPAPHATATATATATARESIQIGWSGGHHGWIWMTMNGFPTGTYHYTCQFGSGGPATFTLTETSSPETWDNGHTCYDLIHRDTVWVTINGVNSNTIVVP